jgi:hypothetical protein
MLHKCSLAALMVTVELLGSAAAFDDPAVPTGPVSGDGRPVSARNGTRPRRPGLPKGPADPDTRRGWRRASPTRPAADRATTRV